MTPEDAGLSLLLDPVRLSALVGRPIRATHLRPKPGLVTVAALVEPEGRPWGWIRTLTGPARAKAAKARHVADHVGHRHALGEAEIPGRDTLVQWGGLVTDPRLGREWDRVLAALPDASTGTVLRHNPLRRLVVRSGEVVLRVTDQPHRHRLAPLVRGLAADGVPVVAPQDLAVGSRGRTTAWPWIPGTDAATSDDPGILHQVGAALAALHAVDPAPRSALPGREWRELRDAARRAVELLASMAPDLAEAAHRALELLPSRAPADGQGSVVLHGDFSLDQCLVAPGSAAVVLTDLDRAARGNAVVDHASFLASALASDAPVLAAPEALAAYADGYAATGRRVEVPGSWPAADLLSRVAEPWRHQLPGWRAETLRRCLLAAWLADQPDAWSALVTAAGRADVVGHPWAGIPTSIEQDGESVRVDRAWPGHEQAGVIGAILEGRDGRGRVRAGCLGPDGTRELLPYAQDRRLPGLSAAAVDGELIVHRAGRRAVVRRAEDYVKVLRPGRALGVADASRRGAALASAAGLSAPEVLGADEHAITFSVVPGRPVHELSGQPEWELLWQGWTRAWTRLQDLGGHEAAGGLASHTAGDEARVMGEWVARARQTGLVDQRWVTRAAELAERLGSGGDPVPVPTHRDLHDKQLLWDGRRLGVLDLDTVCLADPALDPANLAVHARLRVAQGLWSPAAGGVVEAAAARVATAARVEPDRWRDARLATLLRLVGVYAFRPRFSRLVAHWADRYWCEEEGHRPAVPSSRGVLS